jgi:hypothetical protein
MKAAGGPMLLTFLVMLALLALYWFPIRRWMNQSGDRTNYFVDNGVRHGATYEHLNHFEER